MLDYFMKLSKREILELVNLGLMVDAGRSEDFPNDTELANEVLIYAEDSRVDENGDRYAWLIAKSKVRGYTKELGRFTVNDYFMSCEGSLNQEYDEVLRDFLTRKFGEEYAKQLCMYSISKAIQEYNRRIGYLEARKANQKYSR